MTHRLMGWAALCAWVLLSTACSSGTPTQASATSQSALPAPSAQGTLVEPLSNGLSLASTKGQILEKFGEPPNPTWDSRTFGYDDFDVQVGGANEEIWHFTIKKNIKLASGIGISSTKDQVKAVFGNTFSFTYDQYKLNFTYDQDRVSSIQIDPANGSFAPVR